MIKDKKKLGIVAVVVAILVAIWLIYRPTFWAKRGIDPAHYNDNGMTGYEWIEENMKERLVFEEKVTNEKTGEVFHIYSGDALREYFSNCNENKPVSFWHRTNDEWTAWEVGYTYGYHQGTGIRYYEDGREQKSVTFQAMWISKLFSSPTIRTHIEP